MRKPRPRSKATPSGTPTPAPIAAAWEDDVDEDWVIGEGVAGLAEGVDVEDALPMVVVDAKLEEVVGLEAVA